MDRAPQSQPRVGGDPIKDTDAATFGGKRLPAAPLQMTQTTENRSDLRGIGFAVAAAISFGTLAISAKFGYRAGADPLPLLAARFLMATGLLACLRVVRRDKTRTPAKGVVRLLLLGAFGYAAESALFFAALENASASVVGLVFYSYPLRWPR